MILGVSEIVERIENGVVSRLDKHPNVLEGEGGGWYDEKREKYVFPLVHNLGDEFEIEGTSVDLRLGRVFERCPDSYVFLGTKGRNTGRTNEISAIYQGEGEPAFIIQPGVPYIGVTIEEVNLPLDLVAKPVPRVTDFSAGVFVSFGMVQPGYYGPLKFGFYNFNTVPVYIAKGFRMITISFETIIGDVNPYKGYHQGGGKITSQGTYAPPR